ncbi:hypothetical protein THIOSC15_1840006 [uncultured Thiomicrorhabdus sp.]
MLTVPEAQLYFTTRRRQFKVFSEGQTTGGDPKVINHSLGYIPFAEAFVRQAGMCTACRFLTIAVVQT